MTQKELVLETLRKHGPLSHRELNNITGLPACSKRISELREDGWDIPDEDYPGHDYGRYVLKGKKCQSANANTGTNGITGMDALDLSVPASNTIRKEIKWRGYKCKKGHTDHYFGSDPPEKIRCAFCNWQEWAVLCIQK